jgi:hypothetical protein
VHHFNERYAFIHRGRTPPTLVRLLEARFDSKSSGRLGRSAFERELEKCFEWRAEAALSLRIEYLLNLCGRGQYPLAHEVRANAAASSPYVPLEMRIRAALLTKVTSIVARRLHSSE